jgi:hypothetical protein
MPTDVRVTAIDPVVRDGEFVVKLSVASHSVDEIDRFIEALEKDGGFRDVLSREERTDDEGLIASVLEGVYLPGREAASAPPGGGRR